MNRLLILIILLTNLTGVAQCPTPTNLNANTLLSETTLSWTENGTATCWEILVLPNYTIGDPIPTSGWIISSSNPFIITGLSPVCNAFFVRSVCSSTNVSPSVVIGEGCSLNTYTWLNTLSNESFSLNSQKSDLQIFPNPAKNVVQIKNNSKINKITIFDSLGKIILIQTKNMNEIDVESLSKGIYLIEALTENEIIHSKLIKE